MKDITIACVQTVAGNVATPDYLDGVLGSAPERIDLAVLP